MQEKSEWMTSLSYCFRTVHIGWPCLFVRSLSSTLSPNSTNRMPQLFIEDVRSQKEKEEEENTGKAVPL